eukprot:scaffold70769_cov46-Phaeocystis_antarctica.AAC.1
MSSSQTHLNPNQSLDGYSRAGDLATHSAFWLSFMLIFLPSLGRICVLTSRLAARTSHAFGALFVAKFLLVYITLGFALYFVPRIRVRVR